jgi:hypothetical protein
VRGFDCPFRRIGRDVPAAMVTACAAEVNLALGDGPPDNAANAVEKGDSAMPWSWIRVSRGTSRKLRDCTAGDTSAERFAACAQEIAETDGAKDVTVAFEPDGRHARVHFYWDNPDVKFAVVFDLEGDQVVDLLGPDEMERVALRGSSAT